MWGNNMIKYHQKRVHMRKFLRVQMRHQYGQEISAAAHTWSPQSKLVVSVCVGANFHAEFHVSTRDTDPNWTCFELFRCI